MTPEADRRLGPYLILGAIGSGGMGQVFRARDTRLDRDVAIKLLPPEMFTDEAARARLAREARLASALNHPNICTIYEVGEADGRTYIAMELVGGRPLREQIPSEGLPVETVMRYGAQVAAALAHAHDHGVVHRDLKSANVVLTPDGRAKVLDFGLARRASTATTDETLQAEPTVSMTGGVVGTPGYLAPEVLRGEAADERSDIWALGVLLYEMTAGRMPFRGRTGHELGAAILKDPAAPLPARVPPGLRSVILRCLEKEPTLRFRKASEVGAALEALQSDLKAPAAEPRSGWPPWLSRVVLAVLVAGVLAAGVWLAWRRPWTRPELQQRQLTTNSPENAGGYGVISPDGKTLAAIGRGGLSLRSVDTGESHELIIPEGVTTSGMVFPLVQWFPDGSSLLLSALEADGTPCVWMLPILGGRAQEIIRGGYLATISGDGSRLAYVRQANEGYDIWCSGPNGEDPRRVVASDSTGAITTWATWAPGGQRLAYLRSSYGPRGYEGRLESCDLKGRFRRIQLDSPDQRLHPLGTPSWLPDGRLVFSLTDPPPGQGDMNLWSLRVNPRSGKASGKPRRITQWPGLSVVLASGFSSDGKRLTVAVGKYQSDLYVGRTVRGVSELQDVKRLTFDDRMDLLPAWAPDDKTILFSSDRNGTVDLFQQTLGSTDAVPLAAGPGSQSGGIVSADGAWILYLDSQPRNGSGGGVTSINRMPIGGGAPQKVFDTQPAAGLCCVGPPGRLCVLSELAGQEIVFSEFDPVRGRGRELARAKESLPFLTWDLSPDGSAIAVVDPDSVSTIQIISLRGAPTRHVRIDREVVVRSIAWDPDGRSWILVCSDKTFRLFRVGPSGKTTALIPPQQWMYSAAPSPDGRYIVYTSNTVQSNIWLLENF